MRHVIMVLVVLLAGCSGGTTSTPGLPVDDKGAELPSVEGYVTDAAIRPLAGALVRLLMTPEINATTNDEGYFAIRRPTFAAVETFVTATAPGFTPRTQQIQLSGYRSGRLDFRLEVDDYALPRLETLHQTDTLRCQVNHNATGSAQGTPCQPQPPPVTSDPPPDPNQWLVEIEPNLAGFVAELYWDATSPATETLHFWLEGPVAGGFSGEPGDVLASTTGLSPLRLEITEAVARDIPHWTSVNLRVAVPAPSGSNPLAVTTDQVYEAYASVFYVDAAPPGYRLA